MFTSMELIIGSCLKKYGYKLELQTPETVKLFASTKKLIGKKKKEKKYHVLK